MITRENIGTVIICGIAGILIVGIPGIFFASLADARRAEKQEKRREQTGWTHEVKLDGYVDVWCKKVPGGTIYLSDQGGMVFIQKGK